MNIAENPNGGHIAVAPMYGSGNGNDYHSDVQVRNARQPEFGPPTDPVTHHNSIRSPIENEEDGNDFVGEDYRGKTSTSSQRTLRYNDFELVQKMAENDPNFKVHIDEGDDKDSLHGKFEEKVTEPDIKHSTQYPDIKMQRLYESNQGPLPQAKRGAPFATNVRNSRHSLPKMTQNLNHSIEQQKKGAD